MKCEIPKSNCQQRTPEGECILNIVCQKVVEQCVGCARIENEYCVAYINPEAKWSAGKICPMATHIKSESLKITRKKRAGQQKQKKHR